VIARPAPSSADRVWWSLHAPTGDDDAHRLAVAAAAFDGFFPRESLRYGSSAQGRGDPLFDRAMALAAAAARGEHLGLSNGRPDGDDRRVTLDWHPWPESVGPSGVAFADVVLSVPRAPFAVFAAEDLTFRLADAVRPWHGRVHTGASARAVQGQRVESPSSVRIAAPFGLPHLFYDRSRRHPLVPLEVAWINVWSADTCGVLGFRPDDERLFTSVRTTRDGARVLSLSTLPLDPAVDPAHVHALRAVYDRFPRIGSRG
jgi:Family of unknown function (DUF5953)